MAIQQDESDSFFVMPTVCTFFLGGETLFLWKNTRHAFCRSIYYGWCALSPSLFLASVAGCGLLTFSGGLTGTSSATMSGMMANFDGGVLVYGELRILSKKSLL